MLMRIHKPMEDRFSRFRLDSPHSGHSDNQKFPRLIRHISIRLCNFYMNLSGISSTQVDSVACYSVRRVVRSPEDVRIDDMRGSHDPHMLPANQIVDKSQTAPGHLTCIQTLTQSLTTDTVS